MKMLDNLQLKSKLLLMAIPPFFIVFIYSSIILSTLYNEKSNLISTQDCVLEAESLANLIHLLQIERGLSVGFVAGNGQSDKNSLLQGVRLDVDKAISESTKVLKYINGDISILSSLDNINEKRKNIDSLYMPIEDVRLYYTKIIASFLNISITTIPSLMNDMENRNAIQAYTHLASVKEALGQIRASLNAAFTNNKFVENSYGTFSASIGAYKINLDKFLILTPSNIATDYGKTFQGDVVDKTFEMIDIAIKKGLDGNFNIDSHFWFETSTKSIDLLRKVEINLYADVKNSIKNKIDTISYQIIMIISIILSLIIIGIIITILLTKNIINSLLLFQNGLKSFFLYLNREKNDIEPIKLDSKDEFGDMAKVINKNIEKIKKGIEEDRRLIDETIIVLGEFEQGDLCQRLELDVSNPALMQLKSVLNNMASNLENNIDNVLKVLEEYTHHNYLNKVDKKGLKEHILKLANGVNVLGNSISSMLVDSLKDGIELENEAKNLKHVVEMLSTSTHEQAASLEETAAAMEEMTSNIQYNASKADEMSSMATQTGCNTKEQSELANKTKLAMVDIQNTTNSINEMVEIIENIAFQTNILSLNAAVEAATAGDAGKGFAVVAQEVRSLANRSADAAKEIRLISEQAIVKSNEGVNIANELTKGFEAISQRIEQTTMLVQDVSNASREQMQGISQINIAVTQLDQMTQENSRIASEADTIANSTSYKAESMVNNALSKEFIGKNKVIR